MTAPSGGLTTGTVACPGTKQPAAGGAFVSSASIDAAISSSFPSGRSWEAVVSNSSGASTTFTVWAICLAHSATYSVVTSSYTADAQSLTLGEAFCPIGRAVVGGGAAVETASTLQNIAVSDPIVQGKLGYWHVYFNNAAPSSTTFVVYAVCHQKPSNYSFQLGSEVNDPAGTQTAATVACPGSSVPLGGGGGDQIQNGDNAVTLNSTAPIVGGWRIYENNGEPADHDIDAQVVCAGS